MKVLDDFDFTPRSREQDEELTAVAWAENNGWISRKIQYVGRRSCPDRLFAGYGKIFLVELKRPGKGSKAGKLSAGQELEFERFAKAGVMVHVFYTAAEVIAFLKRSM